MIQLPPSAASSSCVIFLHHETNDLQLNSRGGLCMKVAKRCPGVIIFVHHIWDTIFVFPHTGLVLKTRLARDHKPFRDFGGRVETDRD